MRSVECPTSCLRFAWLMALLGSSCARHEPAPAPAPRPLPEPTHYLGEPFALGAAHCRLLAAEPMLTEPASPEAGLVAEDVSVVETSFACEDAHGAVPFRKLAAELRWLDQAQSEHAPSSETRLARSQPDHAVFEVPSGADGLMPSRRFDARSGEPVGRHEPGRARLLVSDRVPTTSTGVVLAPWPRLHDAALDAFLEQLARSLATAAPFEALSETEQGRTALVMVSDLYGQTLEQLAPKLLSLRAIEQVEGQSRLTIDLLAAGHTSSATPSASFSFELARGLNGRASVVRLLDPVGTQAAVECATRRHELTDKLERARSEASHDASAETCNALGVALPTRCAAAPRALLDAALRVQTDCSASGALELDVAEPAPAPSDFEVTLRRARPLASLDSSPRYVLTLARAGSVRFDGPHRKEARAESEGRTSPRMLAALWARIDRLGWFERATATHPERCAGDDRGDLISIRAGGRARSVRDASGCRGEFSAEELASLARAIEHVAAIETFMVSDSPDFSSDAEIWVVAAE